MPLIRTYLTVLPEPVSMINRLCISGAKGEGLVWLGIAARSDDPEIISIALAIAWR
jgi:hypothetical protein